MSADFDLDGARLPEMLERLACEFDAAQVEWLPAVRMASLCRLAATEIQRLRDEIDDFQYRDE